MSILTQVRQRCLSAASRRFDTRDGYGCFPHHHYQTTMSNNITLIASNTTTTSVTERNHKFSASCYKLIPGRCQNSFKQEEETRAQQPFNTPEIYHMRNPVLERKIRKQLIGSVDLPSYLQIESQRRNFNSRILSMLNSVPIQGSTLKEEALIYHLLELVQSTLTELKELHSISTKLLHRVRCNLRNCIYKHQNDQKSHDDDHEQQKGCLTEGRSVSDLIPIIALLGLFKSRDDSEEEHEKLTDEQKMRKMKPVEIIIAKGVLAMTDQEHSKASQLFHDALRLAQDEKDEDRETLVLNLLAANYYESGDFDNAEKLFIDIMKRLISLDVEPTDPAILELSLKLASIYSRTDVTHEKALKGFKFVINSLLNRLHDVLSNLEELELKDISEDKRGELALLGWSYDWFAKHLIMVNDINGAVEMLKKALKISLKVLGPLHEQTLILLNDVGTTLAMNDRSDEGETYIKRAVEGAIESKSNELASFYVNLGLINLKLRKLSDAKRYCEYSIELGLKNREHHNSNEVVTLSKKCLQEVEQLLQDVDNY